MITVTEAIRLIRENGLQAKVERIFLIEANGFVLAEPILSVLDTPPFDQSAMDGYAFAFDEWDGKSDLFLSGEVQAGNYLTKDLMPNEAIRIFTGAPLPPGTDTVVIQENVIKNDEHISIKDDKLIKGSNVRMQGSQIKNGEIALPEGHILSPASISFLAGLGIASVPIYSNPVVSIIGTGKELVKPGVAMSKGQIYESNSFGLTAALGQMNIVPASIEIVDDEEEKIVNAINNQLRSDILIITGGVSVGDYDFVISSLEKCGVKEIFHKIQQKPGKPLYFGKHQQALVFGLPGNPASALTCFYKYVADAISGFTKREYFKKVALPLANEYKKKAGLTYFLKGKTNGESVNILNNQESYMMNTFAVADCIIELEESKEYFLRGEVVDALMIV